MFVAAHVSSMKTRRLGSRAGWRRMNTRRAWATSGRSCSAACRVFFGLMRRFDGASVESCGFTEAGSEEGEFSAAIGLPFDELEPGDLSFDLAAAPGQGQCGVDGSGILFKAEGKGSELAVLGLEKPRLDLVGGMCPDNGSKPQSQVACLGDLR